MKATGHPLISARVLFEKIEANPAVPGEISAKSVLNSYKPRVKLCSREEEKHEVHLMMYFDL